MTTSLATRLTGAAGSRHVVAAPEELVTYAVDGLSPAVIVRPESAAEVVEVVPPPPAVLPEVDEDSCDEPHAVASETGQAAIEG